MHVTKADIVERVQGKIGGTRLECAALVESVLNIMKKTLETGEDVKITGFGKFSVRKKNDRKGRNPQTGEDMTITARRVLSFKPSPSLKTAINGGE
jgi:integration host factor subunit alpha